MNEVPSLENPLLSVAQVAKIFAVKPYTVRMWLKSGKLKGRKVNGQWKVLKSDMIQHLQEQFGDDGNANL